MVSIENIEKRGNRTMPMEITQTKPIESEYNKYNCVMAIDLV